MIQIPSNLDPNGSENLARPSMFARSGREVEFQDALDRYLADYRKQRALITPPHPFRLGARLPLAGRIADWLGRKLRAGKESSAQSGQTLQ